MSRVEGAHSIIKTYLQCSTGDLKMVYDSISLLLSNQHAAFEAEVALNKSRSPHTAMDPLYAQLLGRVSSYALGQIWAQRHELASPDPVPACTKTFRTCMGMPCSHEIRIRLDENASLILEDVHSHWHFLPHAVAAAQPLVLEPTVVEVRGRPNAAKERPQRRLNRATRARQLTSTLRQPSAFERIDNRASIRTRSQCLLEPTI
jgi:hypothetical protein